ncbi:hypothetical protein Tco_1123395 [Tanacetum coccineum]|uniref:Transmembrane protein n=1 Tax=Tanacetum coccineum TaxID=301880 RepID=A0ABQ5J4W4_9ASTR
MGCQGGGYKILKMSKHNVHFISKVQVEVTIVETTNTSGAMIVMMVVEKRMTHDRWLRLWWRWPRRDIQDVFNERVQLMRRMDVVFDGAFGGVGDEEVVVGEGVVVTSSSLEMLTNNCLGGIMVNLIFLEGLKKKHLWNSWYNLVEEDEDDKENRRST